MLTSVQDEEVQDVMDACIEQVELTESIAPDRTYEEGVLAALRWVTGEVEENPFAALDNLEGTDEDEGEDDADGQD
jgi:hypothetical protein